VARPLTGAEVTASWLDVVIVIGVIVAFYSVLTRRGTHATAGEALFDANYLTVPTEGPGRQAGLARIVRAVIRELPAGTSPELARAADVFRVLADQRRLRLARLLLERDRTAGELADEVEAPQPDVLHDLAELQRAGIAEMAERDGETRYAIAGPHVRAGLAELLVHASGR
jgi:DNA-binding transcriptional ArsR family regulator